MQRRKFLVGMGSLAAGGAAATGTGAFTDVEANRSLNVSTAGDSDALLAFQKTADNENGQYAEYDGGEIAINLDSSANVPGSGVNQDATTRVFDIFDVRNQGSQNVLAYVPPGSLGADAFDESVNNIYIDPQFSEIPNGRSDPKLGTLPDGTKFGSLTGIGGSVLSSPGDFETDLFENNTNVPYGPAVYLLRPGESFSFGMYVKTIGSVPANYSKDFVIRASADLAEKAGLDES